MKANKVTDAETLINNIHFLMIVIWIDLWQDQRHGR